MEKKAYILFVEPRLIFFARTTESALKNGSPVEVEDLRMCVYFSADCKGVI